MNYWLMKSEPDVFSIDDLKRSRRKGEPWDGVRNYQARNMLRDRMQPGDLAFFYHSSCDVPGITGVMEIVSGGYPDPTQFDPDDPHYDPKSDPAKPRWFLVDVRFRKKMKRVITLSELRGHRALKGLQLLRRGNRLSVMPVGAAEWKYILGLEAKKG